MYASPGPAAPAGSARVVLARTSVPPCFSVMPMPRVMPALSPSGRKCWSYWRDSIFGSRSEEHTSELQSLMRISYAVFCLKKKRNTTYEDNKDHTTHQTKQ